MQLDPIADWRVGCNDDVGRCDRMFAVRRNQDIAITFLDLDDGTVGKYLRTPSQKVRGQRPEIAERMEGRLPRGLGVARLCDCPAEWSRQYRILGLPSP